MATTREQFIELLKQDVEQFETAAKRIEELLPHLASARNTSAKPSG